MSGFLRQIRSALSTPPLPPFDCSNGGSFDSEVVGESNYQEELRWLLSRHGVDGVARIEVRPEPQNKYDKNAVVVLSDRSRTVGYVPKDVAWIIQPPLAAFVKQHGKAWCQGQLRGGIMAAPIIGI